MLILVLFIIFAFALIYFMVIFSFKEGKNVFKIILFLIGNKKFPKVGEFISIFNE